MSLFKELFKFGFSKLDEVEVFETEKPKITEEVNEKKEDRIEDILYDKVFECPICYQEFKSKMIKVNKNRLIRSDSDLKPYYKPIDPSWYEVLHCSCGYTGISRAFNNLVPLQKERIKQEICAKFKEIPRNEYRTIEDVIELYKLALLNTIAKKGKDGEKGFICLKIAWLYRDLEDKENERIFLEHALRGLAQALEKERFPLFYLDENTVMYIVGDLYNRVGKKEEALRWLGYVVTANGVPLRLKERARELRQSIKSE